VRIAPEHTVAVYRNGDKMMVVSVEARPTFRASLPRTLFEGRFAHMAQANYDVAADGRFLMLKGDDQSPPRTLRLAVNWSTELAAVH
jgi:hypothetical protein